MKGSKQQKPPRITEKVLGWLLNDDWQTALGDFEEYYNSLVEQYGVVRARWWYRGQVIKLLPTRLYEKAFWSTVMLKNYLKTALRTLVKRASYTAISLLGLTAGIACFLMIGVYVHDELNFDQQYENANRIFRITNLDRSTGKQWAPIGPPVGQALAEYFPEIQSVIRFHPLSDGEVLGARNERFREPDLLYADPSAFDAFGIPLLQGNSVHALDDPYTIVLTERLASKYFGKSNPVGQTVTLSGHTDLRVTGVIPDLLPSTHLPFDALISMSTFYTFEGNWIDEAKTWAGFYTYLLLSEDNAVTGVEERLSGFINSFYEPKGTGPASEERRLILQPVTSIHLHSHLEKELQTNGNVTHIWGLGTMAVFLLFLAVINFINLTTARSAERTGEVGVRRSLGALHSNLIKQFLMESQLLVLAASGAAYLLVLGFMPFFRQLSGKTMSVGLLFEPGFIFVLFGLTLLIGFLAGSYPAFVLAKLKPAGALKGGKLSVRQATRLRESLIVLQFVVAVVFLVGTAVIYQQMQFLSKEALGFNKEQLIDIRVSPSDKQEMSAHDEVFKNELLEQPEVKAVTFTSTVPGMRHALERFELNGAEQVDDEGYQMRTVYGADRDYVETLGLTLLNGQGAREAHFTDSIGALLINQSAVHALGLTPEQAVGRQLTWTNADYTGNIVGVVEDYHYSSFHQQIEPLIVIFRSRFPYNHILVRVNGQRVEQALQSVEAAWARIMPGALFDYAFMDAQYDALYRTEIRLSRVITIFSALALLIACLGLFGLMTLIVGQRTKEIGVRKVLGASVPGLAALLTKDFVRLVMIGFLVAVPLSYLLMQRWLEGFAYHTEISGWIFLVVGLVIIGLCLMTVGYQAARAAMENPVKSLRYE